VSKSYSEEDYLIAEDSAEDVIAVRRSYIDLCDGDLNSALLMSQIRYWHKASLKTGKTKLRIVKDGVLWIAKKREDWWTEVRLTPKQVDRSLKVLVDLGFVEKKVFKFNGDPTLHVRALLREIRERELSLLTAKVIPLLPSEVKTKLPSEVISITETTTKNTTKTKETVPPSGENYAKGKDQKKSGWKGDKSTKNSIKKKKSVSELENEIEDNMDIETIDTLVVHYKKQPMINGNLSEFWVRCLRAEYPGTGLDLGAKLIPADKNRLRMATAAYKGDLYKTLGLILSNWVSFTQHAEKKHGAFKSPDFPTIAYLQQWKDAVLSFKVLESGVSVMVTKPKQVEKVMHHPAGKKSF